MAALLAADLDCSVLVGQFCTRKGHTALDSAGEPQLLALGRGPGDPAAFWVAAGMSPGRVTAQALAGFDEHSLDFHLQ